MAELNKVGQSLFRGMLIQIVPVLGMGLVLGFMVVTTVCAGLINIDLIAPVFWLQFMALFPIGLVGAIGWGLFLRRRVSIPLDRALGPVLGPQKKAIGALSWAVQRNDRNITARFYRYALYLTLPCESPPQLRFGRKNGLQAWLSKDWQQRDLPDGIVALGKDATELDAFLAKPGVSSALQTLLAQDGRSLRSVYFGTSTLVWLGKYIPDTHMTHEAGLAWVEAAEILVNAAETG